MQKAFLAFQTSVGGIRKVLVEMAGGDGYLSMLDYPTLVPLPPAVEKKEEIFQNRTLIRRDADFVPSLGRNLALTN